MHQNKNKNQPESKAQKALDDGPHKPVLIEEVLSVLDPQPGETYLDLTAGYGGHASAIIGRTQNYAGSTLIDRDQIAIDHLDKLFSKRGVKLRHEDYLSASLDLIGAEARFDLILADLGVSSAHLNEASRGFTFLSEGPLDMRMDRRQLLTAADIVNLYSEEEIERILHDYGEEPHAKKIARLIVQSRPIHTTTQLAAVAAKVWPGHSRKNPATRTFQALRIAVNDELEMLRRSLPIWLDLLSSNGRLGVISFHSLEDRLVKHAFQSVSGDRYDAEFKLLTKHPVTAGHNELAYNPRSRSAKLRVVAKIKTDSLKV